MATINLNNRTGGGNANGEDRPILPTDMYRMKCIESSLEDDTFSKPNKDGSLPQKIVTVWEVTSLTDDQQEAAEEAGQEWKGVRVWQRFNPFYGDVRAGGPSKLKAFLDDLRAQGHLPNFDIDAFEIDSLVGIEQRVSVQQYIKTMGENAGKPGNKITAFAPIRTARQRREAQRAEQPPDALGWDKASQSAEAPGVVGDEDLPF